MRSQAEEFHNTRSTLGKRKKQGWAEGVTSRLPERRKRGVLSWRVEAHAHTIEVSFGGWSRAPRDLEELPNGSLERGLAYPGSSTWECWVWAGGLFLEGGRPEEYAGLFDGPYANTQ